MLMALFSSSIWVLQCPAHGRCFTSTVSSEQVLGWEPRSGQRSLGLQGGVCSGSPRILVFDPYGLVEFVSWLLH